MRRTVKVLKHKTLPKLPLVLKPTHTLHQNILIHGPFLYFSGSYIDVIYKLNKETEDLDDFEDLDGDIEDLVKENQDLVRDDQALVDDLIKDDQDIGDEMHRGMWGSR